jgi:phosphatidylethanolamine/phosphatidyl-N-methylethanolamine N-methyltransferase
MVARKINAEGGNVLEIGCNQGQILNFLNPKIQYNGIDIAEKCIEKALKKYNNYQTVDFKVVNGENTHFLNNSFDSIILTHVLSVTPTPTLLLRESYRLLKPGGIIYIVNHFSDNYFLKKLNAIFKKFYFGVNLYFPFSVLIKSKGFIIVKQKKINLFWTYLELKKT